MTLSQSLASFIVNTKFEDLPQDVVDFAKICILDWMGSAVAGKDLQPIKIIDDFVRDMGGAQQATLVTGGKSSVAQAAFVNGAASHIVELDDIHRGSIIHAGTVVIPAALAVAEWKNKSGRDLIEAVAIGYEVCYRIGEAVTPSHYYYWHNTATCGTFGAAAAAAKLLDLNTEQIMHTLGSAGTQASGLWEFIEDGAMSKQLHPGKATMNGVISALLSKRGFTGASQILEGRRGFFEAMSKQYDPTKITNQLGEIFKIIENSFKIHASCRHTHATMDLAIDLSNEHDLKVEDIEEVTVQTYQVALDITDNAQPNTVYASKFSLQFCTALALVKRQGGLLDFTEESLHDPVIRGLMEKVKVGVEPSIHEAYPEKWGSSLQIQLANGEIVQKQSEYPKGDPENPPTKGEMVAKFKQLASKLPEKQIQNYINDILHLEELPNVKTFFTIQHQNSFTIIK
ncbi:2-methylcitrate dehydratase PrpD [Alteribacillus persepolensis]|uniref:2-methylcitrate dehydratase PrpD n=1 Tax=Alteribacillus persepolensis TaxID=568899 RepID=A0A1G8EJC1_9BACI|nr:MmgE/PrpD family protein [Alteribacillus persepolensis]SDH70024.1 2-methylcitrate dehydratase PrpD [Alteribacillus persepolensis]